MKVLPGLSYCYPFHLCPLFFIFPLNFIYKKETTQGLWTTGRPFTIILVRCKPLETLELSGDRICLTFEQDLSHCSMGMRAEKGLLYRHRLLVIDNCSNPGERWWCLGLTRVDSIDMMKMAVIIYLEEVLNELTDRLDVPCRKKRRVMDVYNTFGLTN